MSGCATSGDVIKAKQEGTEGITREYPVNFDQAWRISVSVLRSNGAKTIEEHPSEGYMLADIGMTAFSWGTQAGIWIIKLDNNTTKVTAVTKRKMQTNAVSALSEGEFHDKFVQAIELMKK